MGRRLATCSQRAILAKALIYFWIGRLSEGIKLTPLPVSWTATSRLSTVALEIRQWMTLDLTLRDYLKSRLLLFLADCFFSSSSSVFGFVRSGHYQGKLE